VTRKQMLAWAAFAMVAAIVLFIAQALIGLNFYDEQPIPWFLRALQWIALVLLFASVVLSARALTLVRSGRDA
jgi:ABC-type transport system involved in multi-copper enzyme maturation permease subunit